MGSLITDAFHLQQILFTGIYQIFDAAEILQQ